MSETPTPGSSPQSHAAENYRVGSWYSLNGHDWQLRSPLTANETSHATPDGEPSTRHATGASPHEKTSAGSTQHAQATATPVTHYLLADIEYGALDESARDAGLASAFGFLLRHHLREQAEQRAHATPHAAPTINVVVGKSYIEITAESPNPPDLAHVWEDLATAFNTPHVLYHNGEPTMGGRASQLLRETQTLTTALLNRNDVYTGALWHNDLTLRTGANGAALAPLDITHLTHHAHPAITRLAHTLNPATGATRHAFWATDASLMGVGFTRPPAPMSADDLLADVRTPAHPEGGTLDTDDAQALMSAAFPLSMTGIMAMDIFGYIVNQLLWDITGKRTQLRADRYTYGEQMIMALALYGDSTVEDARILVRLLLGLPAEGEISVAAPIYTRETLPDYRIADFISQHTLEGHCERILHMRRAEIEDVTPDRVREHLERAVHTLHLPSVLARDEVAALYPPLIESHLTLEYYGAGKGKVLPPPLDVDDIERNFFEPTGTHFTTRCHTPPGEAHFLAPHRLSISTDHVVTEWYANSTPASPLIRRTALAWREIIAWTSIGEAIALMDIAGRVIFIVPTLFDQVGPLYDCLRTHEATLRDAGVPMLSGGERELREHVRKTVAHMNAKNVSRSKDPEVSGTPEQTPRADGTEEPSEETNPDTPSNGPHASGNNAHSADTAGQTTSAPSRIRGRSIGIIAMTIYAVAKLVMWFSG